MADPMHQFEVQKILDLPEVTLPLVGVVDLSVTNSSLAMAVAASLVLLFFSFVTARPQVVPGRLQVIGEGIFGFIDDLATSIIGKEGRAFFPFVFTLFLFILAMNILGLFLVFTATSQLAVTVTFGLMTIALVVVVGFFKSGLGFFKLFLPSGVPWYLWWLVIPIEVISFLLRPVTLSLRLFGNMLGATWPSRCSPASWSRWAPWRPARPRPAGHSGRGSVAWRRGRPDRPRVPRGLPSGFRFRRADLRLSE